MTDTNELKPLFHTHIDVCCSDRQQLEDKIKSLAAERAELEKKAAAYREVACNLVNDFKKFSSRQHELLVESQTLDSASKNWESYPEAFSMQSIDFGPLIKLVEADRILKENDD